MQNEYHRQKNIQYPQDAIELAAILKQFYAETRKQLQDGCLIFFQQFFSFPKINNKTISIKLGFHMTRRITKPPFVVDNDKLPLGYSKTELNNC